MNRSSCLLSLAATLFATPALAGTTFDLPFSEDFEGRPLGPDNAWVCPRADDDCTFARSANGEQNERSIVGDAYSGSRAYQFVIDTQADPAAYREEGQTHPRSDDIFKGDTVWIGYAIKVPADMPTTNHFMSTHQIKLLDPQCQVRLGFEGDQWRWREAYNGCGGGVSRPWVNAPLQKGQWQTVVVKQELKDNGSFSIWIDNDDESSPNLVVENRGVFPNGNNGDPCYLKLGLYNGWWRVHPEDVIRDRWIAKYDDLRVCKTGDASCGFSFVHPGAMDTVEPGPDGGPINGGPDGGTADGPDGGGADGPDGGVKVEDNAPGGCSYQSGRTQSHGLIVCLLACMFIVTRRRYS